MKITVFNGSPRAERGNTHVIVEAFLEGASKAGAEVENIFLAKKKIGPCLGCFTCWTKSPGVCAIKDDMAGLLPKFIADIIVFATPLYVYNVTGIMKNFLDRMIPVADPHFEKEQDGESRHVKKPGNVPKLAVISNCGLPEQIHFKVLELYFRVLAKNMHTELVAEIYRGGGEILKEKNLMLAPLLWNYKGLLKKAGKEVVEKGKLSEELKKKLEVPIIPEDMYIKAANDEWNKMLKK